MIPARSSSADRAGLFVLVAGLAAALLVAFLAVRNQTEQRATELVDQGSRLVKALAAIPKDGLVPSPGRPNPLAAVLRAHGNADLAYGLVTDPQGQPLSEVTAPGLTPSVLPLAADKPAEWFGHRPVDSGAAGLELIEFHGPLLHDGRLEGFVRVAFRAPTLGFDARQLPFLAGLALPILLLVPLFFFMLRSQLRPLQEVSQRVEQLAASAPPDLAGDPAARDLVTRFGRFLDATEKRIRELEAGRGDAETAIKLLGYKREKVESALETLPEGVLVLDEGSLTVFANTKVGPLLSVDPAALVGKRPTEWPVEGGVLRALSPLLGGASTSQTADFHPDGNESRRVSVWALPLFAPRDATRRLGSLIVLRETTDQMLAAQARDEFIAHVAHELKTPLANITLYGELLRDDPNLAADTRVEAINTVCDESRRAAALINNLLNISRIEAGSIVIDRQRVRLAELLADCMEQLQHTGASRDLRLQVSVPPELPPVELDKDLLRIALNNLLTNAAKYNRAGGEIILSAEETDERIVITVQDSGIGIPAADLPRIFDKFYRSADREAVARGGHGLGLYLARQIVELHQGQIEVTSQTGQGTRVTLSFRKPHVLLRAA
ncbi:PAS domain-containing sensor histidine kinase [Zoogloea sp. 1C4]|uniref:sensor histidine kinase n=1 Tax=Zoogloea sp. 1C4 TaxID=2570190 RepID=UPI001291316F|nr:PAS domain-containing sensor histidine kinase [Zoogloea sp. 1C4]